MYKIFKSFNCRTVKGTNLEIRSGTILKSYVLNPSRDSITLAFPDMTVEVEDDFDIKEHIIPIAEEDIHEQQKDRTYRHGVTKNYGFVDNLGKVVEDCKDEEYKRKRVDIGIILDYLRLIDCKPLSKDVIQFLQSEKNRLDKEYFNLSILNADDKDIISQALIEMSNKYRANNQFTASNKIDEVRRRFLDNETETFVKTNLNYHIKVKLNDYGKQIHHDYWKDICKECDTTYELKVDEEGYSMFQIHDFMNMFGEHARMGAKPFLETCDVLIERSK